MRQLTATHLTPAERAALSQLARREGRSLSQMLRQLVREKAQREGLKVEEKSA